MIKKYLFKKGFTLVEIMIVVAVIVILTAVAIPNIIKMRIAANDVLAQSTLKTISTAMESYMMFSSRYPEAMEDLRTANPPYLNKDYFTGTHAGFVYTSSLEAYNYTITAVPESIGKTGTTTFTARTGGILEGGAAP